MKKPRHNRDIFFYVKGYLLEQGKRCQTNPADKLSWSDCAYKNWEGSKCAVGCLIPDDMYDPKIEGAGITCDFLNGRARLGATGALEWIMKALGYTNKNARTLQLLQHLHDHDNPSEWPEKFDALQQELVKQGEW